MHFTKFFSIVEGELEILNPTSHEKLMLLADYCAISDGDRVLDVGSGKGYMLRQWAKHFGTNHHRQPCRAEVLFQIFCGVSLRDS